MTLSNILEDSEHKFVRSALFVEQKSNDLKNTLYQKSMLFCASPALISYANLN
jgi:hypothetical protein